MKYIFYIQWYRDQNNGQQIADNVGAHQFMYGVWPCARLYFNNNIEQDAMWEFLWHVWKLNAMNYQHIYTDD